MFVHICQYHCACSEYIMLQEHFRCINVFCISVKVFASLLADLKYTPTLCNIVCSVICGAMGFVYAYLCLDGASVTLDVTSPLLPSCNT